MTKRSQVRTARKKKASAGSRRKKVSRTKRPDGLSLEAWQLELRRQFGREQDFKLVNLGDHPVFSEFEVYNPESKSTYRVAIRGIRPGENYCSCNDFATNSLGTCKHIEFTLGRLERKRGGKTALKAGYHPPYSEIYLQYGAQREVRFRPGTDCPRRIARLAADLFDAEGRLTSGAFDDFESFVSKVGRSKHELRVYDDALSYVAEVRDASRRKAILAKAFPRGVKSAAFGQLVKTSLYDYQCRGALFAAQAGRVLIGDEMGLGKTVQAIAAVEIMVRHFGVERVLIVCPTSLKHQWEQEILRFADRSVQVVGGLRDDRERQFGQASFYKVVNYEIVRRDLDLIEEWAPDVVILDEAQRIKNWETKTAQCVKKISSPYAIVLTGTPLENRLEELVSIVQFVDRHRLGPTFRFLNRHQECDESGRVVGYRDLDRIAATLKPILLRRRKDEVLDELPERLEKRFFVPLTPEQQRHHEENREVVARIVNKWKRFGFLSESDQRRLMIALQNMRMACDSTYLLDHKTDHGVKADEAATLLAEMFEDPAAKVVVFSQWTRMLELIVRRFEHRDWEHVFFHGGVPSKKRKGLVDRFREDPRCRAFLSTDAGGVGLNLQHAGAVVNLDLPWNPAVLEQRIGRVHRLGQTRAVHVVHFIAEGTIEEGMLSTLNFKKSLFAGVLDGGQKNVSLGGSRLKRFMESVENATGSMSGDGTAGGIHADTSNGYTNGAQRRANGSGKPRKTKTAGGQNAGAGAPADSLAELLNAGAALLSTLANATAGKQIPSDPGTGERADAPLEVVQRAGDERPWVQFRLPERETLEPLLANARALLDRYLKSGG